VGVSEVGGVGMFYVGSSIGEKKPVNDIDKSKKGKAKPQARRGSEQIGNNIEPNGQEANAGKKRLILHIGAPRTGSSALQDFFTLNAQQFKNLGYYYLVEQAVSTGQFSCSGNGARLLELCDSHFTTDAQSVLSSYFTGLQNAICSHEDFFHLTSAGWRRLREICDDNQISPYIIAFVRNPYGSYLSTYNQFVKMEGETKEFIQFVMRENAWRLDSLKHIKELFSDALKIIHYDSNSRNLSQAFLAAIGIPFDSAITAHPIRTVNRSLTSRELQILLEFNRVLGDTDAKRASRVLIAANPEVSDLIQINPQALDIITERHRRDVDWLNITFFSGKNVFSIAGELDAAQLDTYNKDAQADCYSEMLLLRWAIKEIHEARQTARQDTKKAMLAAIGNGLTRAAKSPYANSEELPMDFNVCGYLLRNLDVLLSNFDPYEHYIRQGKAEKRVYDIGPTIVIRTVATIYESQ
jgi:hypothetical protein